MANEHIALLAKQRNMTRAAVSMEKAATIEKPVIFTIGNAPTALIKLYEMMEKTDWKPAFIIGVPVGFVNVEAAKELILKTNIPYIINRGQRNMFICHKAMRLPTKLCKHLFIDSCQCHIGICHDISSVFYQLFQDFHCSFGIAKRFGIIKVRAGMYYPLCNELLFFGETNLY